MAGPKKQDFWPKINVLKGNHCILRIQGAPVCQKLGMILENKLVQKLKLEKMGWRHFVDNDISWTVFFKMGDFSWTFSKGDFSWTLLVTSRGQF